MHRAAAMSLANRRIGQALSHCVILGSLDRPQSPALRACRRPFTRRGPAAAPCLQGGPALSRNQRQAIMASRRSMSDCSRCPIIASSGCHRGHCDHQCIAAGPDLWFGGTGIPLSRRGLPGTFAPRDKARQTGWRHTVAACANVRFARWLAVVAATVVARSATGEQDGV
jgi:hypothetical protein